MGCSMEKPILIKIAIALAAASLAVTGIVLIIINVMKKDSYRSILIYELSGKADIVREEVGEIDAVEQLYLESGDRVRVAEDSSMRLKLDDDKYVTAEENTEFCIEAAGTKADSKTKIQLTKGAITNEIQNPLSADSAYEVTTPNAVMAVRGTIFRVEVYFDEDGKVYTKLSTFEGKVSSRLIYPDGTMDDEVSVEGGDEVVIYSDTNLTEYLRGPEDIKFEELPLQSLYTLQALIENQAGVVGISKERLEELIREKTGEEPAEEETEPEEPEAEEETDSSEEGTEEESGQESEENETARNTKQPESERTGKKPAAGVIPVTVTPPVKTPPVIIPPIGGGQRPGGETPPKETSSGEAPPEETSTEEDTKDRSYTVRFLYQGQVFGTQTVKHGETASRPVLSPAVSGDWNFDFATKIEKDTDIEWKP